MTEMMAGESPIRDGRCGRAPRREPGTAHPPKRNAITVPIANRQLPGLAVRFGVSASGVAKVEPSRVVCATPGQGRNAITCHLAWRAPTRCERKQRPIRNAPTA